jgi:ABC-type cobalamin/Fe3+-siderophores transport system ATPase subunit
MELMVKDLVVGYRDSVVIDGFNAAFSEGRTVVLGPNGSGKTTLLRAIAGVFKASTWLHNSRW